MAHLVDNWVRDRPQIRHNPESRIGLPTLTEKPRSVFFSPSDERFTKALLRRKLNPLRVTLATIATHKLCWWRQNNEPASAGPCEPLLAGCSARAERRAGDCQRMTAVPVAMAASMPLSAPAVK